MKEENDPHAWLCILTSTNFKIVKKERIYATPEYVRSLNKLKQVKIGDILLFYIRSPVKRVRGMAKVTSQMFVETNVAPWTDRLYPYRIRISDVKDIDIPFEKFVGKISNIKYRIPFGASMIPLCKDDLNIILGTV